jgi:hypothetical protein
LNFSKWNILLLKNVEASRKRILNCPRTIKEVDQPQMSSLPEEEQALQDAAIEFLKGRIRTDFYRHIEDLMTDTTPPSWGYEIDKSGTITTEQIGKGIPEFLKKKIFLDDKPVNIEVVKEAIDEWIDSTPLILSLI